MRYTEIISRLNETHFNLNTGTVPTEPFKNDDTITVYHGFRDIDDALLTAKYGTSGAMRAARVYSYEADNNPKGLFVTPTLKTATEFGSTVIEFDAAMRELEPPVWPGGIYTGHGGYSQYWGRDRSGRAKRSSAQTQLRSQNKTASNPDYIRNSDDPLLASTLTSMGEMQALYVGHLNPTRIKAIHLRDIDPKTRSYASDWYTISREEFIEKYKDFDYEKSEKSRESSSKLFEPDQEFDPTLFIARLKEQFNYGDIEASLASIWKGYGPASVNRGQQFKRDFSRYLWPKQIGPAFNWFKKTFKVEKPN